MTQATVSLDDDQIALYEENGFLSIDRITEPEEIEELKMIYDRLFEEETTQDERKELGNIDDEGRETLPQVLAPHTIEPALTETQLHVNAVHIAKQLIGEDAEFNGDHAILKPAQYGAPTPWHQDEAYWDPAARYHRLSIWVPFGDATVENGCMQFVPGSHEYEVLPHHEIEGEGVALELDDIEEYVDKDEVVACEIPAGGATIHDSKTFHYTAPNQTDEPRRAYVLTLGLPKQPRDEPRDFYWLEA